ncbi:MAG TPA: hypothetical protein VMV77_06395 [Bacteroidales bacterium]|nr:hypothetical protein [Bacteroidales bacterium]
MKNLRAIIIMLLISLPVFSQEETVNILLDEFLFGNNTQDSVLEAILINETDINDLLDAITNYKFIYARSEFENKTYFSGQDLGINQYNIVNQVFYQGPKGLNVGVTGILYSGFNPKYNTTIASFGYNKRISNLKGASLRAAYNRFFFAKVDSIEENSFNSSISLGATYQLKNVGTSLDFSLLIGNDPSAQFSWDIFSDFTILKMGLFSKLKFAPEISLYFGNETVVTSQYINFPRFSGDIYSEKSTFGLMNSVIRIPLNLTYKNFDLRAGYNFNFPRIPGGDLKPEKTSFLNISVGYMFGF